MIFKLHNHSINQLINLQLIILLKSDQFYYEIELYLLFSLKRGRMNNQLFISMTSTMYHAAHARMFFWVGVSRRFYEWQHIIVDNYFIILFFCILLNWVETSKQSMFYEWLIVQTGRDWSSRSSSTFDVKPRACTKLRTLVNTASEKPVLKSNELSYTLIG